MSRVDSNVLKQAAKAGIRVNIQNRDLYQLLEEDGGGTGRHEGKEMQFVMAVLFWFYFRKAKKDANGKWEWGLAGILGPCTSHHIYIFGVTGLGVRVTCTEMI